MLCDDPRTLPGYRKKSLFLNHGGGEIWFEHLDGIYKHSDLVLEKFRGDLPALTRPSSPSAIGFVLDETEVTRGIIAAISDALLCSEKIFRRVCFIGTDKKTERALRASLKNKTFALAFINDFDRAKDWLVRETL